jgi:hypothetical protein
MLTNSHYVWPKTACWIFSPQTIVPFYCSRPMYSSTPSCLGVLPRLHALSRASSLRCSHLHGTLGFLFTDLGQLYYALVGIIGQGNLTNLLTSSMVGGTNSN